MWSNKRLLYNVNRVNSNKALDAARMTALKRYTFYFYPECNRPIVWQLIVITIKEGLHCEPAEKKKSMHLSSNDNQRNTKITDTVSNTGNFTTHHNTNPYTSNYMFNQSYTNNNQYTDSTFMHTIANLTNTDHQVLTYKQQNNDSTCSSTSVMEDVCLGRYVLDDTSYPDFV